jgi:ubiquinone/menaquinone biosynthesis C-methylase UbiE
MKKFIKDIFFDKSLKLDQNGILVVETDLIEELKNSKDTWERIFDFNLDRLKKDRENFNKEKLLDHIKYFEESCNFNEGSVILEIGCGPAYIGEYLMKKYGCFLVGVDFNYQILLILKKYFDERGYKKYLLIHGDINKMPIKNDTIDFIYGGGVIEHFPDTDHILTELFRVLKKDGVSLNTVPAFNLWWLLKFYNNIPSLPMIRKFFEYIHIELLDNKILKKSYGYEISFTKGQLLNLYKNNGFSEISIKPFAFHPSSIKVKNKFLRDLFYITQKNYLTAAFYSVNAKK